MIRPRVRCVGAAVALGAAAGCAGALPPPPAPTNPIRFVSINDVYLADTLPDGGGGLARVAAIRDRIALEGPTLFVLAGDVLSPGTLGRLSYGKSMVDALNAARLDYATFGEHDFEYPRDSLLARIAESKFKWVSTNCTDPDGARFAGTVAWDTVRLANRKIGLFGLTLAGTYGEGRYVRCADPEVAARQALDTLAAQGAELIVAVTHQPLEADRGLLNRESRIDLILGGHEHEAQSLSVASRHVLKADANARSAQFATLWGVKGQWREAVTLLPVHSGLPVDSATASVVAGWEDSLRVRSAR